jgi:predicted DNA-binding transcriptional regulator AlpA
MDDLLTRPPTQYVRAKSIRERLNISQSSFYRLCHHPDPLVRFPRPALILGSLPLWAESDIAAYVRAHQKAIGA